MTKFLISLMAALPFCLLLIPSEHTKGFFDPVDRAVSRRYRGFFALIVILHHIAQRISISGLLWAYYDNGYTAVAMFFFYSGYGLMKKGIGQKEGYFRRRLPGILFPYLVTMILYWIFYGLSGDWKSFGSLMIQNLNTASGISFLWYVFVYTFWILFLGIGLRWMKEDKQIMYAGWSFSFLFLAFCILFLPYAFWIYDTVLLIPCGCVWAFYEPKITDWLHRHYRSALIITLLTFIVTVVFHMHPLLRIPAYMLSAILFMILLNLINMKFRPVGKALDFLGGISYEIYLLHGLPITFLRSVLPNDAAWTFAVLAVSAAGACLLHEIGKRIWNRPKKAL